ncbi:hypothetical protein HUJ05_001410 [Dendroctonus ponderosae]|nr:hypothetical protein HUJ05_001410 [Dendroctonus ponderosae]
MSATVASPASLGPWSASQRKAASRIFAQALFSALPKPPRIADLPYTSGKEALVEQKIESGQVKKQYNNVNSYESDQDDYSDEDESGSSYSESDYYDSSIYSEETCKVSRFDSVRFFLWGKSESTVLSTPPPNNPQNPLEAGTAPPITTKGSGTRPIPIAQERYRIIPGWVLAVIGPRLGLTDQQQREDWQTIARLWPVARMDRTQKRLLSDSCSSLLQKITTRVRGPSATVERQLQNSTNGLSSGSGTAGGSRLSIHHPNPLTTSKSSTVVPNFQGAASKNRSDDKYSSVLDRIYGRRRESERKPEPSIGRGLAKSSTTANVLQLSEKAYPYVNSNSNNVVQREKTPFRSSDQKKNAVYPEPSYSYLDRDSIYRVRHRSNHSELRPRRSSKPHRVGKSEHNDRKTSITTNLKLTAVEIPMANECIVLEDPETKKGTAVSPSEDDDVTPTPSVPDPVAERETKRKEIQSLIMKYSALDEAYNKTSAVAAAPEPPSVAAAIAQKYYPETTKLAAVSTTGRPFECLKTSQVNV